MDEESNRPDLLELTTPHTHVFHDNGVVCAIKITPVLQGDAAGGRGGRVSSDDVNSLSVSSHAETMTKKEAGDKGMEADEQNQPKWAVTIELLLLAQMLQHFNHDPSVFILL